MFYFARGRTVSVGRFRKQDDAHLVDEVRKRRNTIPPEIPKSDHHLLLRRFKGSKHNGIMDEVQHKPLLCAQLSRLKVEMGLVSEVAPGCYTAMDLVWY